MFAHPVMGWDLGAYLPNGSGIVRLGRTRGGGDSLSTHKVKLIKDGKDIRRTQIQLCRAVQARGKGEQATRVSASLYEGRGAGRMYEAE